MAQGWALKSLLARLMLIVSVALVPAIAFQAYTESEARRTRQRLVEDEALRLVRLVASEQQRIAEGAEQVLNVLGGAPAVQDGKPEDCQRLLANLLRLSPRYNYAAVIGLDGHLLCAPGPFDSSVDVSDRPFFQRALQTGGFVIGDYTVGRFSKQPTIHMAKPFKNGDGAVAGVIEVALSLDWLGKQLERLALPPEAVASIKDRNGTVLARYPDGARFVGHPMVAENRFSLEGTEIKVVELTGLDGKQRITAYSPLGAEPKGLRIGVGLDRDVTFAPVTQANLRGLILIIAGAVLALTTTALAGTRLIRRPLDRLLRVADQWRHGDLAARTGLPADNSEFGRLAAAFDSMAVAQENRERTLRVLSGELAARVQQEVTAREQMRFIAHHDSVTSLPNRTKLRERLEQVIERKSFDGRMTAVILVDLDGFKGINDTMGHQAGDQLLKEVADRLLNLVRRDDIVARLGGDEFVILQFDLTQTYMAEALAQRLIARLAEPTMIAGQQVRIGASAGVALYPLDGADSDTLLKHADMALYCAKTGGRGTFRRFDRWMARSLQERRALENDLRRAFEADELELYFQPQFSSADLAVTGFEALLRWNHPDLGSIPPASFVAMAEACGLIESIGCWVLERACREAVGWGIPCRVAVNVSPLQIKDAGFGQLVAGVLARTGLPPALLEIEVTEGVLIDDDQRVLGVLRELKSSGVRLTLDDFGTGYSSLSYLLRLPFDKIKIDKSFIQEQPTDSGAAAIVEAILLMSRRLGLEVVAEGVETEQQLAVIRQQQCMDIQGFLLARPMAADEVGPYLRDHADGRSRVQSTVWSYDSSEAPALTSQP